MMIINEVRQGDLNIRAGIIIRCRNWLLAQHPTPSVKHPNPMWEIPKGRLRPGESIKDGAVRECWEESGIKFESWKLECPIQVMLWNEPLYLFLANLDELIPLKLLSCASTFVDQDGIRKPETDGYRWIEFRKEFHLIQKELLSGISYYFNKFYYHEDCQIAGDMMGDVPPNVGSVLSLGYKNGRVLPPPEKITGAKDYTSIPHF
jgi:8-oxo-dGTP pyrophosphatase MutT (NUDIX family)